MRLLFIIDHLGLGGAQRQMVDLACGLEKLGHSVEFFVYFPQHDFFRRRVEEAGIAIHQHRKGRGFSLAVIGRLFKLMRGQKFDAVLAYLNNPTLYAELARLLAGKPVLVVSERCSHHDDRSAFAGNCRRTLHVAADTVVSNSRTHAAWLGRKTWLSGKVASIYNGFDLAEFDTASRGPLRPGAARLLAVGRICPQKNPVNLIEGLHLFYERNGYTPHISWAGKQDFNAGGKPYGDLVRYTLDKYPEVKRHWHWLGEQRDMRSVLSEHDGLVHPSRYEGLPNAVCEALASAMPVVVSDVCDHSLLVAEGKRGFLFDPESPASIAAALQRLLDLSPSEWAGFSADARQYAEHHLALNRMVRAYETLFFRLVGR